MEIYNNKLDEFVTDSRVTANELKYEGDESVQSIKKKIKGTDSPKFSEYTREILPTFVALEEKEVQSAF